MASSLARQLAQVAANSKATLNVRTQKAAHSKSLIWEPRVAATQSYQALFTICHAGFEELCQLDNRFASFRSTIFSEESQDQDRSLLTATENAELDRHIEAFLRLVGARIRLMPAIKAIEWLIRRFRIHHENTGVLLMTFLPYHSIQAFVTLLDILPSRVPHDFRFLDPYIRSKTAPPRSILVHQAVHHPEFLTLYSEYTLESCRTGFQYPAQIVFWGGLLTEAVNGVLSRAQSGRAAVQSDNTQNLLHRLGPIFAESLIMKKVPSLQIASYMAVVIFVSRGNLEDATVTAFMEQTVRGWTTETMRSGLICLAIMAQFRSAKQMSSRVTKALMKVPNVGSLLVDIGRERRVDKLANGLCLALIERFTKKGDSGGLPTIMAVLKSQILKEKQMTVVFKSLLLTALKLNDDNDEDGKLGRELGSALMSLSQTTGKSGDIIQSVIQDVDFDIEELEMKLDLSFRTRKLPMTEAPRSHETPQTRKPQNLEAAIDELSARNENLPACMLSERTSVFEEFSHLFFSVVSENPPPSDAVSKFNEIPALRRQTALQDCVYFSFFMKIWCGPYPALARAAALNMVEARLQPSDEQETDLQALIPYAVTALGDTSRRVRQAAAQLIVAMAKLYVPPITAKASKVWGSESLYGKTGVKDSALPADVVAKFLHLQIVPAAEACVMDAEQIFSVLRSAIEQGKYLPTPQPALDKKDHMGRSARLALLSFFAHHAEQTPLLLVKDRLLKGLNEIKGVGSTTRTQLLLPILQWWGRLSETGAKEWCQAEQLDAISLNSRFVDIVAANDTNGVEALLNLIPSVQDDQESSLVCAIFDRIKRMWPSMKDDIKFTVASKCLQLYQERSSSTISVEAAKLLHSVALTTEILSYFLQVTPELSSALRTFTFVLQLVDDSDPVSHPELLDDLFSRLTSLQQFRAVVGSELGYLQNLILRSLRAMMPAYKADKELKIDSSGGYCGLLVNCIQKSSSSVVQNAALLLIADLATTAPDLVLHGVMPIFTFMGDSVLRQGDDYSAHVVSQTVKEVIPPLIQSLREGNSGPVAGASEILVSFTTAYEHIPAHRRLELFVALIETLGPRDFLFALVAMLVDRYDNSDALLSFIILILNRFDTKTQLETFDKILDLVADLFKPKHVLKHSMSSVLLDTTEKDRNVIALRQLSAIPVFLGNKKLRSKMGDLADCDDMNAAEARESYTCLLEKTLVLADTVKADPALHGRCGSVLSQLLNLLTIGEFIKAVENLLDKPDFGLRQRVLRALEIRVDAESNTDTTSRSALLAFLPQLTAVIRESNDIRYKHTAVTCVDKIAEKYGKKDLDAVIAAALTIAGECCLGQGEKRLRIMALLCLTSLADVLQGDIVPIIPVAFPWVIKYLQISSGTESRDAELHTACYGLISSLAEHVPYLLSDYLEDILVASYQSAQSDLDDETCGSRRGCLEIIARRVGAKELFTVLEGNWARARDAGYSAMTEYLAMLSLAVEKHNKSSITKNSAVLQSILMKGLDLRRQAGAEREMEAAASKNVAHIEEKLNEMALKMIYKLNDAAFRPMFVQLVEWASTGLPASQRKGLKCRRYSVYGFLRTFFGGLGSIVTNYATYVLEDAVKILKTLDPNDLDDGLLWNRVLQVLKTCFEHDQDDFWQAPSHFGAVAPALLDQFLHASVADVSGYLIPALVELAAAADSQAHQKDINAGLMKHLKSESTAVRLAAVKCQQELTDRLGEEWLSMLHEMLPRISELQEDDDEVVERETQKWILKIEGVLGEPLDAMLQ